MKLKQYILILSFILFHLFCVGQELDELTNEKVSRAQRKKAVRLANSWIENQENTLGIPENIKLSRLFYEPDEIVWVLIEELKTDSGLSDEDRRENLHSIALGQLYTMTAEFENQYSGNKETIHFKFRPDVSLLNVFISSGEEIIYQDNKP